MAFQDIPKIENSKFYVDLAFKKANDRARSARQKVSKQKSVLEKSKIVEIEKLRSVRDELNQKLSSIIKSFPSLNNINEFYFELLKCYVDIDILKKSLGALKWCAKKIEDFFIEYKNKIKITKNFDKVNSYRTMFYGRVSSTMKRIDKNLKFVEEARRAMRNFPVIKEGVFTVAIAGFPNVGKTTLLSKLSGANAEIAGYAFTTKSLNTGYITKNRKRIVQLIDTPGTLNRKDRMNEIETQAELAMKHIADMIVYVFDPTETYPMKDQEKLLKKIKTNIKKKVLIYVSKTDLAQTTKKGFTDAEELKEELIDQTN